MTFCKYFGDMSHIMISDNKLGDQQNKGSSVHLEMLRFFIRNLIIQHMYSIFQTFCTVLVWQDFGSGGPTRLECQLFPRWTCSSLWLSPSETLIVLWR